MSAASSAGSADSTRDSVGLGFNTRSSVSRILGGEGCLQSGSPESLSTTTYELFNLRGRDGGSSAEVDSDSLASVRASSGGSSRSYIFSAEASPAKTSPAPDDAPDSKPENAPASSSSSHGSPMSLFGPEGMSSLRTYPDYFPAKADEISPSYSRRWPSSGFTTSPGECWTADISECPNEGGVSSSLADVLQADVPAKYFLSPRAAAGILRRAEKRGRELPPHLSQALSAVATMEPEGAPSSTPTS